MPDSVSNIVEEQIKNSIVLLQNIFGEKLLGVYLYGSYMVGGLQRYSDIDFFVVLSRASTFDEKSKLALGLLEISGIYMQGDKPPIEMTLVEKSAINPWQYPPTFDFQYGEWLRESFEKGIVSPWSTKEMSDLAIIITQILLKSKTLLGIDPKQLLVNVPYEDFIKAMLDDLSRLTNELESDTRNVLLTLARIWSTLETGEIRSKPDAANWVIMNLSPIYHPVMNRAKAICIGQEKEYWDDIEELLSPCSNFIVAKVNELSSCIAINEHNKCIKLAENI